MVGSFWKLKEYNSVYRENNKEKIKEQDKQKYINNKDKISKYKKHYYETKKEQILERQKELYTCECGSEIQYQEKARHERTKKHLNYLASKTE